MSSKFADKNIDELFEAFLKLKDVKECYSFFEDLCTITEIKAMAQRLQVAKMLVGQKPYTDIAIKTGASSATISRVSRCINYGENGYKMILERLEEDGDL